MYVRIGRVLVRRAQQAEREEALGEERVEQILEDDALLHKRAPISQSWSRSSAMSVPCPLAAFVASSATPPSPLFPGIPVRSARCRRRQRQRRRRRGRRWRSPHHRRRAARARPCRSVPGRGGRAAARSTCSPVWGRASTRRGSGLRGRRGACTAYANSSAWRRGHHGVGSRKRVDCAYFARSPAASRGLPSLNVRGSPSRASPTPRRPWRRRAGRRRCRNECSPFPAARGGRPPPSRARLNEHRASRSPARTSWRDDSGSPTNATASGRPASSVKLASISTSSAGGASAHRMTTA